MAANSETWETISFNTLAEYNARDAFYTHKIMRKIIEKFKRKSDEDVKLLNYYKTVLLPLAHLCAEMESRGCKVDDEWCRKIDSKYYKENRILKEKIEKLPKVSEFIREMTEKKKNFEFNLGSPDQIRDIVTRKLGIRIRGKTKGGKQSVKYDNLQPFERKSKFISLYVDWKEKETLRNNALLKFPKYQDDKGLIHPNHNPAFQVTTRVSVSNPPKSNLSVLPEIRGIICSRFKKGKILSCDYKQLEMRLLADRAEERGMLDVFNSDGDVHNDTARRMFGKNFTKEQRDLAKNINFGTVYGIEMWSFSKKFHVDVRDAEEWLEKHKEIYPDIYDLMDVEHNFVKKHGWVEGAFGSRRRLPEALSAEGDDLKAILRQAGNYPIQNMGAAITDLAGIAVNRELEKMWEYKSVLYHIHHDCLNLDCPADEVKDIVPLVKRIMEKDIPKQFCPWLKVSLPVEAKVSYRWGGLDE